MEEPPPPDCSLTSCLANASFDSHLVEECSAEEVSEVLDRTYRGLCRNRNVYAIGFENGTGSYRVISARAANGGFERTYIDDELTCRLDHLNITYASAEGNERSRKVRRILAQLLKEREAGAVVVEKQGKRFYHVTSYAGEIKS